MRTPTVVLLTTYPIAQPRSGGQIRARALAEHYTASGFEVFERAVIVAGAFRRQEHGSADVEYPLDDLRSFPDGVRVPHSDDLQSGWFLSADRALFEQWVARFPRRVDVFHLEQPWLLPAVQKLRALPRFEKARVVYGSQNLEAPLRESICRQQGLDAPRLVALTAAIEREACGLADLTLAVSESDARGVEALGARRVVLAANGIHAFTASQSAVDRWRTRLGHRRIALFVGSAHPPNAAGFIRAFGDALGFVPPDACIVVAGRVGDAVKRHYEATRYPTLNAARMHVTGELSDEDLSALKVAASIYLLPIFEGGGSNIKTSEAILSGRPIIASPVSLRGFERYASLPEVTIADTPAQWVQELGAAFLRPEVPAAPVDALREALLWKNTLASVGPAVRALVTA